MPALPPPASPASQPARAQAAPGPLLAALRAATHAQHERLDQGLAIGRPHATLHDYTRHATALRAWLAALTPELLVLQTRMPGFDFAPPERLLALQADLRDAGAATLPRCASVSSAAPVRQALERHARQADAVRWGLAYVVEGSQLGGQVLYRQLAARLAPHPLRYLRGHGAHAGARWRAFTALLGERPGDDAATAAACDGARAAFAALQQQFDESPAA